MEHVEQNAILIFAGTVKCRGPFFQFHPFLKMQQ